MKPSCFIFALVFSCLGISAFGQMQSRTFDNFDTTRGVNVLIPTPPPPVKAKKVMRKNAQGKWVAVTEDKLVKKTVQTRPTAAVQDSLALREPLPGAKPNKLIMGTGSYLKGFTTGDLAVDSFIVDSSRRYSIDPLLIYSQMHQESSFKLRATSYKGASGLMQLMPGTARRFGVANIYDAKQNIEGGVKYMRWLLDTFNGDLELALAGYNAGEGAVMKYGWQIPPYRETQEYVRRITYRYNSISDPRYVQTARKIGNTLASKIDQKSSRPLYVYERDPLIAQTSDGKMMLVNR